MTVQRGSDTVSSLCVLQVDDWVLDPQAVAQVGESVALRHSVLPLGFDADAQCLHLAMTHPEDGLGRAAVRAALGDLRSVVWHAASDEVIAEGLKRCYAKADDSASMLRQADELLYRAVACGASDLHLTPDRHCVQVRARVDGGLRDLMPIDLQYAASLIVRFKVMADLDLAETRQPQDGRLYRIICARRVEMRFSTFPLLRGERLVIRLHDASRKPKTIDELGLNCRVQAALTGLLQAPSGLIVVSGPTGSGKTTTLYAMLRALDDGSRALMTLEDPVEHIIDGVSQSAVDPSRAIDFASGIRALLRQDPDVLLIGEIRDADTCRAAIRAALSGLRVLASVHADDSCSVVTRLLELGADRDELAAVLVGAVAQRLLRYKHYAGRVPIVEVLSLDASVQVAIRRGATADEIAQLALDKHQRLEHQARSACQQGLVGADELLRVFGIHIQTRDKEAHGCAMLERVT